jgi:glycosyltransferase involved in cell wall biosynthesis
MSPQHDGLPATAETFVTKLTQGAKGRYWPSLRGKAFTHSESAECTYPIISVVTPSYNQAAFLEETICSVICQRYPKLEYIVMDGGSTDGSQQIIERYAPWITRWTSVKDNGQADAIHKGFQKATGDILCWLNSDDIFIPGVLWCVAEFFTDHPDIDCAVGGNASISADGRAMYDNWGIPLCKLPASNTFGRLLHWGQYACPQMSTFWRSKAYWRVGGLDAKMQFCMDRDLFLRLAAQKPIGRIPYFLSCYRYHGVSKGATMQSIRGEEDHLIDRRYAKEGLGPLRRYVNRFYYSSDVFFRKWWLRITHRLGVWSLPKGLRCDEHAR